MKLLKSRNKYLYEPFYDKNITPVNKKYSVMVKSTSGNLKIIHFGDSRYQQYHDQIGRYQHLDHFDRERRKRYRQRHIKDNINNKNTPGYWSWWYLW